MAMLPHQAAELQSLPVYRAEHFLVSCGANYGDGLSFAADLILDDIYTLDPKAKTLQLSLRCEQNAYSVATGGEIGIPGARLHFDCAVSLMGHSTKVTEVLVLAEVDQRGHAKDIYLLPLATLQPKTDYRLIAIDHQKVAQKLAQISTVSFAKGTQITLGSGEQRAIEDLCAGDLILTRNDGAQPLRWVGQNTQRAVGAFAPVHIAAGTLNNTNDLVVGQNQRLCVHQEPNQMNAGHSEVMIKAGDLMNGRSVKTQEGGFIEYFQLLFDHHQIVFAEGIATESFRINDTTVSPLNEDVLARLLPRPKPCSELDAFEKQNAIVDQPGAGDLLRRASKG